MLFSKVEITLDIDGEKFEISVSKMTQNQIETHAEKFSKLPEMVIEHDDRLVRMQRLRDRYELNKEIGNAKDAISALNDLESLENTNPTSYKSIKELFDMVEESNQSRFMMTVSGKDKDRLKKVISEKRFKYGAVNDAIDKLVEKAEKGKSIG